MTLSEALLPEFDKEMENTRKTLERVPEDKFAWKPHEKSGSMGWLASFLAVLPTWGSTTIEKDALDIAPPGQQVARNPMAKSRKELLATFDKNVNNARDAIAGASDAHLMKPWMLLKGGQQVLCMPPTAVLRFFLMNHMIHHRAQLGVYLRLNNIAVPAMAHRPTKAATERN